MSSLTSLFRLPQGSFASMERFEVHMGEELPYHDSRERLRYSLQTLSESQIFIGAERLTHFIIHHEDAEVPKLPASIPWGQLVEVDLNTGYEGFAFVDT